jgi:hypothetical protein
MLMAQDKFPISTNLVVIQAAQLALSVKYGKTTVRMTFILVMNQKVTTTKMFHHLLGYIPV